MAVLVVMVVVAFFFGGGRGILEFWVVVEGRKERAARVSAGGGNLNFSRVFS